MACCLPGIVSGLEKFLEITIRLPVFRCKGTRLDEMVNNPCSFFGLGSSMVKSSWERNLVHLKKVSVSLDSLIIVEVLVDFSCLDLAYMENHV